MAGKDDANFFLSFFFVFVFQLNFNQRLGGQEKNKKKDEVAVPNIFGDWVVAIEKRQKKILKK